jgi:hypothetical protein
MVGFYTEKIRILNLGTEIAYPDWHISAWFFQIN